MRICNPLLKKQILKPVPRLRSDSKNTGWVALDVDALRFSAAATGPTNADPPDIMTSAAIASDIAVCWLFVMTMIQSGTIIYFSNSTVDDVDIAIKTTFRPLAISCFTDAVNPLTLVL